MATENIRLSTANQLNITVNAGYFYTFDYAQDNLIQKTDDGNTAFTYPLDTLLSYSIFNSEFDGVYFWTAEDPGANDMRIRRWKIDNYVCKQQQAFAFAGIGSHYYDFRAFSVAHYHDSLALAIPASGTSVLLNTYGDDTSLLSFTTTSGVKLKLHVGPNSSGQEEDVYVSATVSGGVTISGSTVYAYAENDPVNFYTYIWFFNNFNGTDSSTGALYKVDAYTGDYITRYASGAYKDITAATFYKVDSFADYGEVDTLCFIKGTNTLFINVGAAGATLPYYGSMVMDNILSDTVTIIPVQDLAMDDQNVYRLQRAPDGGSSLTQWSFYSYVLSSLDSFVTSISLAAYPAVIAANTISTSTVVATVKDQFLQPIVGRLVAFTDDDSAGYVVTTPVNTDPDGKSITSYKSGNTAREVKITAVVEQT